MNKEQRGNLYLLTGLVLGIALGLLVAWVISPLEYTDTEPGSLAEPYKAEYRRAIAMAYNSGQNMERARQRLNLLGDGDPIQVLAAEAQRMLAEDQSSQEARALALLAADLNSPPSSSATSSATSTATAPAASQATQEATSEATGGAPDPTEEPSATPPQSGAIRSPTPPPPTRTPTLFISPTPTLTPIPTVARATATPIPVQAAPYVLESQKQICDGTVLPGLIQIEVMDGEGQPQPGVKITVAWEQTEETFFTGLVPEISPGYADFLMASGTAYTVRVGELSDSTKELSLTDNCAWSLVFRQD